MTIRVMLVACVVLGACARQETPRSDSVATLPSVDTLEPATDSLALRDSTNMLAGTTSGTKAKTSTSGTKTGTKRDSTIIGRDSVTPFDPKRKSLPPAKRP